MWRYYSWLAWLSIKNTPVLSSLMVLAIAMGIAACLTTLTLHSVISSNPLAHKNNTTFALQLDSWDKNQDYWDLNGVPPQLTYRDAKALYDSGIADEIVLTSRVGLTVNAPDSNSSAKLEVGRLATRDFFTVFDVRFKYGGPWSQQVDRDGQKQVVISEILNNHFFNGENSVGKLLSVEGESYKITGIVNKLWQMTPSVYDLNMGVFKQPPQVYLPFFNIARRNFTSWGNRTGWKNEDIRSHSDYLASESVWIQSWATLKTHETKMEFEHFISNHIEAEKQKGRFERPLKYHLNTPEEWLKINKVVSKDNQILVFLSLAFLGVCLVNAIVLLLAKFLRKAPEASLRRALGASRTAIFVQHMAEASLVGLLGGLLGLFFTWLGLMGVRQLYSNYHNIAVMSQYTLLAAMVFVLACSAISGALPAWQVAKAHPSRHLKSQ